MIVSSTQFAEKYHTEAGWIPLLRLLRHRVDGILRILRNAFTINNTDLTKHVAAEAQIPLLINEISIELYQHKAVLHISSLFL